MSPTYITLILVILHTLSTPFAHPLNQPLNERTTDIVLEREDGDNLSRRRIFAKSIFTFPTQTFCPEGHSTDENGKCVSERIQIKAPSDPLDILQLLLEKAEPPVDQVTWQTPEEPFQVKVGLGVDLQPVKNEEEEEGDGGEEKKEKQDVSNEKITEEKQTEAEAEGNKDFFRDELNDAYTETTTTTLVPETTTATLPTTTDPTTWTTESLDTTTVPPATTMSPQTSDQQALFYLDSSAETKHVRNGDSENANGDTPTGPVRAAPQTNEGVTTSRPALPTTVTIAATGEEIDPIRVSVKERDVKKSTNYVRFPGDTARKQEQFFDYFADSEERDRSTYRGNRNRDRYPGNSWRPSFAFSSHPWRYNIRFPRHS